VGARSYATLSLKNGHSGPLGFRLKSLTAPREHPRRLEYSKSNHLRMTHIAVIVKQNPPEPDGTELTRNMS